MFVHKHCDFASESNDANITLVVIVLNCTVEFSAHYSVIATLCYGLLHRLFACDDFLQMSFRATLQLYSTVMLL